MKYNINIIIKGVTSAIGFKSLNSGIIAIILYIKIANNKLFFIN